MNKKKILFANLIIIIFLTFTVSYAASAKAEALLDISNITSDKKVVLELKLSDFEDIDLTRPIGVSGFIDYDNTIFSDIEMASSINGWSGQLTKDTCKFLADGNSMPDDGIIAKFTLTVADGIKSINNSQIKLNSIEIAVFNKAGEGIKLNNLNLTAQVSLNNTESNSNGSTNNVQDNNNENTNNINNENSNQSNNINKNEINNNVSNMNNVENSEQNENQSNIHNTNRNQIINNNLNFVEDLTTTKDEKLPQTGVKYTLILFIFIIFIISVILFIKYKKFYD